MWGALVKVQDSWHGFMYAFLITVHILEQGLQPQY